MNPINVFAIHHEQPVCVSGDLGGRVCYSNLNTGEIGGILGSHDDSVESIEICKDVNAPYAVSCGMDPKIKIYSLKDFKMRSELDA